MIHNTKDTLTNKTTKKERVENKIQKVVNFNIEEIIKEVRKRDYKSFGFENSKEFLKKVTTDDDYDRTVYDQGYIDGMEKVIKILFNNL